jgi:hypothetical protein
MLVLLQENYGQQLAQIEPLTVWQMQDLLLDFRDAEEEA